MSFLSFRCYETRRIFLNRYITRSNILGILVIHSIAGIKPKYYLPIKQSNNQTIKQSNNQSINQSNNQTIKQSNNQSNNQTINQSNKQFKLFDHAIRHHPSDAILLNNNVLLSPESCK
jgi:hypothetical protein